MLRKSKEYQVAFAKLRDCHGVIDDVTFEQIEEFVCQMDSVRRERNVNAARLSIFSKNFKVTNVSENFIKSAINFDGSSFLHVHQSFDSKFCEQGTLQIFGAMPS